MFNFEFVAFSLLHTEFPPPPRTWGGGGGTPTLEGGREHARDLPF